MKARKRSYLARRGLVCLEDAPRPGPERRYGEATRQQVPEYLDQPPPPGYARWNGRWLAEAWAESAHVLLGEPIHTVVKGMPGR